MPEKEDQSKRQRLPLYKEGESIIDWEKRRTKIQRKAPRIYRVDYAARIQESAYIATYEDAEREIQKLLNNKKLDISFIHLYADDELAWKWKV